MATRSLAPSIFRDLFFILPVLCKPAFSNSRYYDSLRPNLSLDFTEYLSPWRDLFPSCQIYSSLKVIVNSSAFVMIYRRISVNYTAYSRSYLEVSLYASSFKGLCRSLKAIGSNSSSHPSCSSTSRSSQKSNSYLRSGYIGLLSVSPKYQSYMDTHLDQYRFLKEGSFCSDFLSKSLSKSKSKNSSWFELFEDKDS